MDSKIDSQNKFARSACLFLAEMLRTRQADLSRAADIAAAILDKLERIESEQDFLKVIKDLEMNFQEIKYLKRDMVFYQIQTERQYMERMVRDFAINNLPDDPKRAVEIMQEALLPDTTIDQLVVKFADFHEFMIKHTDYYDK